MLAHLGAGGGGAAACLGGVYTALTSAPAPTMCPGLRPQAPKRSPGPNHPSPCAGGA